MVVHMMIRLSHTIAVALLLPALTPSIKKIELCKVRQFSWVIDWGIERI